MSLAKIEEFFGVKLPKHICDKYSSLDIAYMLDFNDIISVVDFDKPFLHTEKIIIFNHSNNGIAYSVSLAIGKIYPENVIGHYNSTIYLALAGKIMPSTATIHLAKIYDNTCPQAIEGKSIRMDENLLNNGLLQPASSGTTFYVETAILRKKLALVIVTTHVAFGQSRFGLIEELKFILTKKDSIWSAIEAPEVD